MWRIVPHLPSNAILISSRLSNQPAYPATAPSLLSSRAVAPCAPRRAHTAATPRCAPAPARARRPTGTEWQVHPRLHQGALGTVALSAQRGPRTARRGRRATQRAPARPAVRPPRALPEMRAERDKSVPKDGFTDCGKKVCLVVFVGSVLSLTICVSGTGYATGGLVETSKKGVAFRG
jgi:hypothetical protein